jgi:hypothetical protein
MACHTCVHYVSGGEGTAYHDTTASNIGGAYRNSAVDIRYSNSEGKNVIGWNQTGEWLKYRVNVAQSGTYDIELRVATTFTGAQIRLWDGGSDLTGIRSIPNTGDWEVWKTVVLNNVNLVAGQREIRLEFVTGEFDLSSFKFVKSS